MTFDFEWKDAQINVDDYDGRGAMLLLGKLTGRAIIAPTNFPSDPETDAFIEEWASRFRGAETEDRPVTVDPRSGAVTIRTDIHALNDLIGMMILTTQEAADRPDIAGATIAQALGIQLPEPMGETVHHLSEMAAILLDYRRQFPDRYATINALVSEYRKGVKNAKTTKSSQRRERFPSEAPDFPDPFRRFPEMGRIFGEG